MAGARPFRFAVQAFSADSAEAWRALARRTEAWGYSALHLADHFLGPGEAITGTNHPVQGLAAVPAMAVAAEVTETLRIGCRVFCVDYRHPAMLAKEAATLDFFSNGRLELGLGAGWLRAEYEAAGIAFDPPGVRIARLAETVAAIKALMAEGSVEIEGEHVSLHGFEGVPDPVQRPHPPIMIGGGRHRILSLAAREADIVSLNFDNGEGILGARGVQSATAQATVEKIEWIRAAAGERWDQIEIEVGAYFTAVTDDATAVAGGMAGAFGLSSDEMLAHPHALIGDVDAICAELERRRETYAISYVTVPGAQAEAFAPVVERLTGR